MGAENKSDREGDNEKLFHEKKITKTETATNFVMSVCACASVNVVN